MRLLPRDERFYRQLIEEAGIILRASRLLLDGVQAGSSRLAAVAVEIDLLERRGDEVIHEILTSLNQSFITPIDPQDIHNLSSSLDNVLDGIEDIAHRLASYRIEPVPPAMVKLSGIVVSCSEALHRALLALQKDEPLMEHCIEVNRLEYEADLIGRSAVEDLFVHQRDPVALIKLREVYEFFETTTDSCEDVADILETVVVKNS
jgi:predicted phosphate transport protein (TIGR00153 family)